MVWCSWVELCPCGKNNELYKINDHHVDTVLQSDWQDCRPRSGRPRDTTANEDRHLRILHLRNRFPTVTSSPATGLGHVISRHTVRRRLRQHGIGAYRPFIGMTLTRQHRLRRLLWARQFQRWQHRNWQRVLFSEESRFQLFRADIKIRIYQRAGERKLRAVFRRLYRLMVELWWFEAVSVANSGQTLLSVTEILPSFTSRPDTVFATPN